MKPISAELLAFLTSTRSYFYAELYEIALVGGGFIRITDTNKDITFNGKLFSAGGQVGPYIDVDNKMKTDERLGVEVSTTAFGILPYKATYAGTPLSSAIRLGILDGATVTVYQAFMPTFGDTSRGCPVLFYGRVADVELYTSRIHVNVDSHTELLTNYWPRNLYQALCLNSLGDTACAVNLATYTTTATALAGSTAFNIVVNLAGTNNPWTYGKVTFTSGVNQGLARAIKKDTLGTPGALALLFPLPADPTAGDTFSLVKGCNKSYTNADGCPKFANTARFRGMPFIPLVEAAI